MNIFDLIQEVGSVISDECKYMINYSNQKKDESHDHRGNCGKDRTPNQKAGDAARSK